MIEFTPTVISRPTMDLLSGGIGVPVSVSDADLATFTAGCETRLLAMLCMTDPPASTDADYQSWLMLLSCWVKAVYAANRSGIIPTASKSIRNYSTSYGNNGEIVLSAFYSNMSDLIQMFNACDESVQFQSDWNPIIYSPDATYPRSLTPDAPPMFGGVI